MNYLLRKLLFYAVAVWAAVTLNFAIPRLLPGNPVDILLAKLQARGATVTPESRRPTRPCSAVTPTSRCRSSTGPTSSTWCTVTSGSR